MSALDRTHYALEHTWGLQGNYSAAPARVDVDVHLSMPCMGSSIDALDRGSCALDHIFRVLHILCLFLPSNHISFSITCNTPKLTTILENNKAKSLPNIS